ncbi:AAA family ATPase [Legionella feeleii]|nr:AAA family ATPase [Legionella feeleii]
MTAEEALLKASLLGPEYGIGFVFTKDDPFWFVDIDDCLVDGAWNALAIEICNELKGALVEISHSGKGLHIIGTGKAPAHSCRNDKLKLEFYTQDRFVALTAIGVSGDSGVNLEHCIHLITNRLKAPVIINQNWTNESETTWSGPLDDDVLLEKALKSQSSATIFGSKISFKELFNADTDALVKMFPDPGRAIGYDESRADASLAQHLAFWVGNNCERIERIMSRSRLFREKWKREDYLQRTILFACANQKVFLQDTKSNIVNSGELSQFSQSVMPSKFAVISAVEFASIKTPPWIIKGALPLAELAMVFGASGSGKSFLVLDLAFSICRGVKWCGHKVRQGRVVYVAAEGSGGLSKRLVAYASHHKIDLSSLPLDIITGVPNFLGQGDPIELGRAIGKATLIVLDTLACIAAGGDENSSSDMGSVLTQCKLLHASTGALIMLVHHMGKDSKRGARGWSGLRAAVDAEMEVTRSPNGFQMRITKLKDGEDGKAYDFRLLPIELGMDEDGELQNSCVVEHIGFQNQPVKALTGLWEQHMMTVIEKLANDGKVAEKDVVEYVIGMMPQPEGKQRDQRKTTVTRTKNNLEKKGYFSVRDGVIFTSVNAHAATIFGGVAHTSTMLHASSP